MRDRTYRPGRTGDRKPGFWAEYPVKVAKTAKNPVSLILMRP